VVGSGSLALYTRVSVTAHGGLVTGRNAVVTCQAVRREMAMARHRNVAWHATADQGQRQPVVWVVVVVGRPVVGVVRVSATAPPHRPRVHHAMPSHHARDR